MEHGRGERHHVGLVARPLRKHNGAVVQPYSDLVEVRWAGEWYVIRAEPAGMPQSPLFLSSVALLVAGALRLLRRDRTWVVRVRRRVDDPLGASVHEEILPSRDAALAEVQALHEQIRLRQLPWQTA